MLLAVQEEENEMKDKQPLCRQTKEIKLNNINNSSINNNNAVFNIISALLFIYYYYYCYYYYMQQIYLFSVV